MNLARTILLPAVVGSLFLAGCGVKPPVDGRADPYTPAQITFADEQLAKLTAVGVPKPARGSGGLLYVTVPVRAATNLQLYVDCYVTFFDENGLVVDGPRLAQSGMVLRPNTPQYVTVNSTTARAADFQLDFRYAK